jgi:predicted nucleic acid-binding protein
VAEKPFIDTNVIVYAFSRDEDRAETARSILERGGIVSAQVLNEFVDVARRKLRFEWVSVRAALDELENLLDPPLALSADLLGDAVVVSEGHGLRIYDSLILSAAKRAGCRLIYSEDLQDGRTIDGVLVRNPFAEA